MKEKLQHLNDKLQCLNDCIDPLFLAASEMVDDFNALEARGVSTSERITASTLQATATAIDSHLRDAIKEFKEICTELGHHIDE